MRTSCDKATHAIIGIDSGETPCRGILHWHDNEIDAHRDAKDINQQGGFCRVIETPDGEVKEVKDELFNLCVYGE